MAEVDTECEETVVRVISGAGALVAPPFYQRAHTKKLPGDDLELRRKDATRELPKDSKRGRHAERTLYMKKELIHS